MTPAAVLAYLSTQSEPVDIEFVIGHFGVGLFEPRCAMLESMLLRLIDDGNASEPLGPFKGYQITDQGRQLLKELTKTVVRRPTQKAMF